MTQEIQKAGNKKPPLVAGAAGGINAIVPTDIEQTYRLAGILAASGMVPKTFERNTEMIMVAIMHGMEVGLTPMAALQSIAVINGMPTIWGDGALGLILGSGLLEDKREWVEGEGDARVAHCEMKRHGQSQPIRQSFSVANAKKANLWTKKGPWTDYPERMLQMRARSWCMRDGFADVLRGLNIREEVHDMGTLYPNPDGSYSPVAPARPTRDDFMTTDANGDPIDEGTDLRRHYAEKAAARQERDMDNAARVAAGKPPLDAPGEPEDAQDEPEGGESAGQGEGAPQGDLLDDESDPLPEDVFLDELEAALAKATTVKAVQTIHGINEGHIRALSDSNRTAALGVIQSRMRAVRE